LINYDYPSFFLFAIKVVRWAVLPNSIRRLRCCEKDVTANDDTANVEHSGPIPSSATVAAEKYPYLTAADMR
jgi:hypothetical protein